MSPLEVRASLPVHRATVASRAAAVVSAPAVRQAHPHPGRVVVLVRLVDPVAWVHEVDVVEAAAQAGHVDPLLRVARRVDVRPAHGRADRDPAPARARAAGRVDASPGGAIEPGAGPAQVAQAVGDLGADAHAPDAVAFAVEPPQLEARGAVELPVAPALVGELELEPRACAHPDAASAPLVDPLPRAHVAAARTP